METPQAGSGEKTVAQYIEEIPQHVTPDQTRGMNITVAIHSKGAESGDWIVAVKDGVCTVVAGTSPSADLSVEATSDTWQSLFHRRLDAGWAYMTGQIQVSGDLGLAMRLQSLLAL